METAKVFTGEEYVKTYSRYRRDTPLLLGDKIISYLKEKYDGPLDMAVDLGCGSGQGTVILAPHFRRVHGMDISEAQIKEARTTRFRPNVMYEVAPAETLPFPDKSVQLVTASSVLHWFQLDVVLPEVRRVLCNNGILAVYGYLGIKPLLDDAAQAAKVDKLFVETRELLRPYFGPQHKLALEEYKSVNFPFEEVLRIPKVRDTFDGQLSDIIGRMNSSSGIENLRRKDEKQAEEVLSIFQLRLEEIMASGNTPVNGTIQQYRDYFLTICRKIEEDF